MNCKNCGAPMEGVRDGGYFFCRYCTSFYHPESYDIVTTGRRTITCPLQKRHITLTDGGELVTTDFLERSTGKRSSDALGKPDRTANS